KEIFKKWRFFISRSLLISIKRKMVLTEYLNSVYSVKADRICYFHNKEKKEREYLWKKTMWWW
ncbi:MAG: hypothetical protein ACPL6D_06445, partial [Thermodesulfobacteriota bacterium]